MTKLLGWNLFFLCFLMNNHLYAQSCSHFLNKDLNKYDPETFLEDQAQTLLLKTQNRTQIYNPEKIRRNNTLPINYPDTNHTIDALYEKGIVEQSYNTLLYFDKLIMYEMLKKFLGAKVFQYHPKSLGLKAFLKRHNLEKSVITKSLTKKDLEDALKKDFPNGFVAKPTFSISSNAVSFKLDVETLLQFLISGEFLEDDQFDKPYVVPNEPIALSGESFFLMEVVEGGFKFTEGGKKISVQEYRVHSLYDHVLPNATVKRWYYFQDTDLTQKANQFVQDFLDALPPIFYQGQALGYDILFDTQERPWIIEINTNRGFARHWSGSLFIRNPSIVGDYYTHAQTQFDLNATPGADFFLSHHLANIPSFARTYFSRWNLRVLPDDPKNFDSVLVDALRVYHHYFNFFLTKFVKVDFTSEQKDYYLKSQILAYTFPLSKSHTAESLIKLPDHEKLDLIKKIQTWSASVHSIISDFSISQNIMSDQREINKFANKKTNLISLKTSALFTEKEAKEVMASLQDKEKDLPQKEGMSTFQMISKGNLQEEKLIELVGKDYASRLISYLKQVEEKLTNEMSHEAPTLFLKYAEISAGSQESYMHVHEDLPNYIVALKTEYGPSGNYISPEDGEVFTPALYDTLVMTDKTRVDSLQKEHPSLSQVPHGPADGDQLVITLAFRLK